MKKMEYKTRQWHEKCFVCNVCKNAIGTKSFIPKEHDIYCVKCYEDKFATKCTKCTKACSFEKPSSSSKSQIIYSSSHPSFCLFFLILDTDIKALFSQDILDSCDFFIYSRHFKLTSDLKTDVLKIGLQMIGCFIYPSKLQHTLNATRLNSNRIT